MANTHFSGPVISANGFQSPLVSIAANTTVALATNSGITNVLAVASGATVTLPAASGSGAVYRFLVGTTITSNQYKIQVANASDYMRGFCVGVTDTAGTAMGWATANSGSAATESDTITLNGTTQGGRIGDFMELVDVAANVWAVRMHTVGSGTEATPFSAAV